MAYTDITFHPSWWANKGFSFEEKFFTDCEYRMETDRHMRRVLYENYGDYGIGEKDPKPRPLIDSDLLAGEYLQAQIMGCNVEFYNDKLPYTHPLNAEHGEISQVSNMNINENRIWQKYKEQFEYLINKYKRVESYVDMHGVQNLALDLRGNLLYEDYICEPQSAEYFVKSALDCIKTVKEQVLKYTKSTSIGVTSIVKQFDPNLYVTSNCTCELISQSTYEEFLLYADKELSNTRPFGIHHCGQTMEHLAKAYAKLKPDFIEIGAGSNIEKTLECFDNIEMVNLRYSPLKLSTNTQSQIENDIDNMISKCSGIKHIGISCVGVDLNTSSDNIKTFLQHAQKAGYNP